MLASLDFLLLTLVAIAYETTIAANDNLSSPLNHTISNRSPTQNLTLASTKKPRSAPSSTTDSETDDGTQECTTETTTELTSIEITTETTTISTLEITTISTQQTTLDALPESAMNKTANITAITNSSDPTLNFKEGSLTTKNEMAKSPITTTSALFSVVTTIYDSQDQETTKSYSDTKESYSNENYSYNSSAYDKTKSYPSYSADQQNSKEPYSINPNADEGQNTNSNLKPKGFVTHIPDDNMISDNITSKNISVHVDIDIDVSFGFSTDSNSTAKPNHSRKRTDKKSLVAGIMIVILISISAVSAIFFILLPTRRGFRQVHRPHDRVELISGRGKYRPMYKYYDATLYVCR